MIGAGAWANVIDHTTKCSTIIPICAEVGDAVLGDDSIDPGKQSFLRRHAATRTLDLVLLDERPNQTKDQLEVTSMDVFRAYVSLKYSCIIYSIINYVIEGHSDENSIQ